ncbi:hypothetical protein [Buchananella hordeovulneris]|uniref:Uncharacterized protein n=1 Tax=Buchananella hordeovulneris TaxID=52770 RepID=A0A1Q5PWI5_9ACTO|nr:hypothetical protein [Buchananella hordeovulneris]MDO5081567.1 hypothetical protein [Buchananella hordeovulneris]OKL51785.1 hypothetical protein BSZ40_06450 [Buchananella hordeovulneris]
MRVPRSFAAFIGLALLGVTSGCADTAEARSTAAALAPVAYSLAYADETAPTAAEVEAAISALQLPAEVPAQAREEILQRATELFNDNQSKEQSERVTGATAQVVSVGTIATPQQDDLAVVELQVSYSSPVVNWQAQTFAYASFSWGELERLLLVRGTTPTDALVEAEEAFGFMPATYRDEQAEPQP